MKTKSILLVLLCLSILFYSCSSDDDGPAPDPVTQDPTPDPEPEPEPQPEVLSGVFLDSAVEGLSFETATQSGTTDTNGTFSYLEGETVTFSIAGIVLGSAPGQDEITPITLAGTVEPGATIESRLAQNIAALLQTLDVDVDETNGITITQEVAANLGVTEVDFTQPIEDVLADIVLNVVQNTGVEIEVVYPFEAANAMATSLELDYEAPENLAITNLLPTIEVYLENYNQNYIPASAVYKNTFGDQGNLTSIEVLSRYSGKLFFRFTFDSHTMEGLPLTGTAVRFNDNDLFGAFPGDLELENQIEMTYNQDHQLSTYTTLIDGQLINTDQFTAYNEGNQPLSFFRDLGTNNPNLEFTITWNFTFEDGLIATANRTFDRFETIDANNSFETITTRDFVHTYNDDLNLVEVSYSRVFTDNFVTDGVLETFVSEASVTDSFMYDGNKKLVDYTVSSDISPSFGDSYTSTYTRTYDDNERIMNAAYSDTEGFQSTTEFEAGVRTSFVSTQDGLLNSEETYYPDGSRDLNNYFYSDGELIEKRITEYDADFIFEQITREFYVGGNLNAVWVEAYNNGILATITGFEANGTITFVDYFDETGFISMTEFYVGGELSSTQEFSYDGNGLTSQVIFKDADGVTVQINTITRDSSGNILIIEGVFGDGSPWFTETWAYDVNGLLSQIRVDFTNGFSDLYIYEAGVLVRLERYDAEGNLYDVVDYTTTGKRSRTSIAKTIGGKTFKNVVSLLDFNRDHDRPYSLKRSKKIGHPRAASDTKNLSLMEHLKATHLQNRAIKN